MKKIITIAAIACSTFSFAGIVPKGTALYYEATYSNFINKPITLNVSSISPDFGRDSKLRKGFRFFRMNTYDKDTNGGRISLIISDKQVTKIIEHYGLIDERAEGKVKLKSFSGTLRYDQDLGLFVVPTESNKINPLPTDADKTFANDLYAATSRLDSKQKTALLRYAQRIANTKSDTLETEEE
ncbi:MAG: hypothetical protein ACRC37_05860 [Lentisphaeria bacterium]